LVASLDRIFREEWSRVLATLVGFLGEHHLGVIVDRFDASDFPHLTHPPEMPSWVVHRWRHGSDPHPSMIDSH
jgi:hypothetical protein